MKLKKSAKRDKIYSLLKSVTCHPTAEWIYMQLKEEIPELSLGTVYRNLEQLTEQGLIQRLDDSSGVSRFDGNASPHYHLSCERCKNVYDIPVEYREGLARELAQASEFVITGYEMSFVGICPECQNNKNN